jgi:hypothetical protein
VVSKRLFNRRYGKGAFARLRSMLADPTVIYEHIAKNLGLTKQRRVRDLRIRGSIDFSQSLLTPKCNLAKLNFPHRRYSAPEVKVSSAAGETCCQSDLITLVSPASNISGRSVCFYGNHHQKGF